MLIDGIELNCDFLVGEVSGKTHRPGADAER
jgi:hypothetical protein